MRVRVPPRRPVNNINMFVKTCTKCKIQKPLEEFSKKNKGFNSWCKKCMHIYLKNHYKLNKDYYIQKTDFRKKVTISFIKSFKLKSKCAKCGETHPACLSFHHTGQDKKVNISEIMWKGWSLDRVMSEINKCEILCENCHRKLHWKDSYFGVE